MGGVDHVGLNIEIVADELRRMASIGLDAADPRSRKKYQFRPLLLEEALDIALSTQVELGVRTQQQPGRAGGVQSSYDGRPDQALMAGDVDQGIADMSRVGHSR